MKFLSILLALECLFLNLRAQDSTRAQRNWAVNGFVKDLVNLNLPEGWTPATYTNLIHNRLNAKMDFNSQWMARVEVRNRLFFGTQIKELPGFGQFINQYNGFFNLSRLWVNNQSMVAHSVIDRAFLQFANTRWNIRMGRQRINWGINTIWNPNDIFNAYNFLDFDYEERPGNDAVRIQRFFSNQSQMELAYKLGKDKNDHIAALLYKINIYNIDFQALSGVYRTDYVVGGGWAGNVKDAGFKGEVSYFHPRNNTLDTSGTVSLSLMVDKTYKGNWYLSAGGLYNSQPANNFGGNTGIFSSNISAKSLFPFRFNFFTSIAKTLSPLLNFTISVLYAPDYHTLILFPALSYNLATNIDLDLTTQSFFTDLNEAYKMRGAAFYLRGRWSF